MHVWLFVGPAAGLKLNCRGPVPVDMYRQPKIQSRIRIKITSQICVDRHLDLDNDHVSCRATPEGCTILIVEVFYECCWHGGYHD